MADWTKRNFEDMEDRSPAGVPMRWRFSRVAPHIIRSFTAEPDGMELICVGGRAQRGDAERFDDFWPA